MTRMEQTFQDKEFGGVWIHRNPRARRLIIRAKAGGLYATLPPGCPVRTLEEFIEKNRERLREIVARSVAQSSSRHISVGDSFPCYGGSIVLLPGTLPDRFLFRYQGDCLQVLCPSGIDLNDRSVWMSLSKGVCRFMRRRAETVLPQRLAMVARRLGLPVVPVSIGRGRQKLGHCTSGGEIQLSFFLMFYPEELIDYVICHEFAHLKQMNHGAEFHTLCDRYCQGESRRLEKRLHLFKHPF